MLKATFAAQLESTLKLSYRSCWFGFLRANLLREVSPGHSSLASNNKQWNGNGRMCRRLHVWNSTVGSLCSLAQPSACRSGLRLLKGSRRLWQKQNEQGERTHMWVKRVSEIAFSCPASRPASSSSCMRSAVSSGSLSRSMASLLSGSKFECTTGSPSPQPFPVASWLLCWACSCV